MKLGVNQHSKEYASIRKREPAWKNVVIYFGVMTMSCIAMVTAYYKITKDIKFEMLDSLDDQKIADERAYLQALASASYSHSTSSRSYGFVNRYSFHSMSAIAEEKENMDLSDEEGPPSRIMGNRIIHEE